MVNDLNGMYCGHSLNKEKSFTRTYKIISSKINNDTEYNEVVLKNNNDKKGTVLISNTYELIPGRTYEFSFYTFDMYEDTIENIFEKSTLIKVVETDKPESLYINDKIYVNEDIDNGAELNEVKHVRMDLVDGTLTSTSATIRITDYSRGKYTYGSLYRIDEYKDGEWREVKSICDNCAFDLMAYYPDVNGHLEFKLNWNRIYGKLKKGKYRIVKDAIEGNGENLKKYYFSVEFNLE